MDFYCEQQRKNDKDRKIAKYSVKSTKAPWPDVMDNSEQKEAPEQDTGCYIVVKL